MTIWVQEPDRCKHKDDTQVSVLRTWEAGITLAEVGNSVERTTSGEKVLSLVWC